MARHRRSEKKPEKLNKISTVTNAVSQIVTTMGNKSEKEKKEIAKGFCNLRLIMLSLVLVKEQTTFLKFLLEQEKSKNDPIVYQAVYDILRNQYKKGKITYIFQSF